jgi:hypothetical protein
MHCFKYPPFVEDKSRDCYAHKLFETTIVTTQLDCIALYLFSVQNIHEKDTEHCQPNWLLGEDWEWECQTAVHVLCPVLLHKRNISSTCTNYLIILNKEV